MRVPKSFLVVSLILFSVIGISESFAEDKQYPDEIIVIVIDDESAWCVGFVTPQCEFVMKNPDWNFFKDNIQGFYYTQDYQYFLNVQVKQIESPATDITSFEYVLKNITTKNRLTDYSYKDQVKAGIPYNEIVCQDNGKLVMHSDGTITCETESSVSIGIYSGDWVCHGDNDKVCGLNPQEDPESKLPPIEIEGFEAEEGHDYTLNVLFTRITDVRTDDTSSHYLLIDIERDAEIVFGNWAIDSIFNSIYMVTIIIIMIIAIGTLLLFKKKIHHR